MKLASDNAIFSMQPVSVWVFTTRGQELWQRAIGWVTWTRGWKLSEVPGHAGIGFTMADGSGVYYEAFYNGGWTGPKDALKLEAWADRPGNRVVFYHMDTLPQAAVDEIHAAADHARGRWLYPLDQLWQMYLFQRFGRRVKESQNEVVCSEGVSRLLYPWIDIPARARVKSHDYVSPRHLADALKEFRRE